MTEAELRSHLESGQLSPFLEALQMEERAKKRFNAERDHGWIDTTEDPYNPYPSPTYGNDIWTMDLAKEKVLGSRCGKTLPFCGRKRIGRNGRVWIDQHFREKDVKNIFEGEVMDIEREGGSLDENKVAYDRYLSKWQFAMSDDEVEENHIFLDTDRMLVLPHFPKLSYLLKRERIAQ